MSLTYFQLSLWVIDLLLESLLLFYLFRRGFAREPIAIVMAVFIACDVVKLIVVGDYTAYFYFYWIAELLSCAVQAWMLFQYLQAGTLRKWWAVALPIALFVAAVGTTYGEQTAFPQWFPAFAIGFTRLFAIYRVAVVASLLVADSTYGIGIVTRYQILGWAAYSVMALAVREVEAAIGWLAHRRIDHFREIGWIVALCIWLVLFSRLSRLTLTSSNLERIASHASNLKQEWRSHG